MKCETGPWADDPGEAEDSVNLVLSQQQKQTLAELKRKEAPKPTKRREGLRDFQEGRYEETLKMFEQKHALRRGTVVFRKGKVQLTPTNEKRSKKFFENMLDEE